MPPSCSQRPRPARRRAGAALAAALLVLVAVWALHGAAVSAVPGQGTGSTTTSEPTITTSEDLLEGETTVAQTEDPTSTTLPGDSDEDSPGGDETRTVWLIVVGLVLIAVLLGLLTWRYWQRTAPARPAGGARVDEKKPTSNAAS